MNQGFELELEKAGSKASLYKIHFKDRTRSEYDRFLDRIEANSECTEDQRNFCKWHCAHLGEYWKDECWVSPDRCLAPLECQSSERCEHPADCQTLKACQKSDMLDQLQVQLLKATTSVQFHEALFRPKNKYPKKIRSMYAGALRLYGIRLGRGIFIAGDGGYKTEKKIYQDNDLGDRYDRVKYAWDRISQKIADGRLRIGNRRRTIVPGPKASSNPLVFDTK